MSAWKVIVDAFRKNGSCDVEESDGVAAVHSLTAAGYRIVGPGEMDAETLERAAQVVEQGQIVSTSNGDVIEPRSNGNRHALAYATAIRSLAKGGGDG